MLGAPRHPPQASYLAELDFACAAPRLVKNGNTDLTLVWSDCNYAGSIAMLERDAAGSWTARDLVRQYLPVDAPDFTGSPTVWSTAQFGAARLPDGQLAVSVQDDVGRDLWCVQGE